MIEKIRQVLKDVNLETIGEMLGRLSERERYIVLGSALGLLALIVIIILTSAMARVKGKEKQIGQLKEDLRQIRSIRGDYMDIEREIERLEGVIRRTGKDFSITTHLEKLAAENNVSITRMTEKTAPPNDLYKERQVEVNLRQIYLKNLVQFLYNIESSTQLLRIRSLQVRPDYANPIYLNVVFSVSTFEPVE